MTKLSCVTPRIDAKPWGGSRLGRYGIPLAVDDRIGEAVITASDVTVKEGFGAGLTLGEIVAADHGECTREIAANAVGGRPLFPLLAKLIDAHEDLSIQVHPDDARAAEHGQAGKTEAWHVLEADPGAKLYLGVREGVTLDAFATAATRADGSSANLMRQVPAQAGMTVLLHAGTIHALGAGVVVYEIQQPSDITYRLEDWGRVGLDGKPRETHLDAGLEATDTTLRPGAIQPADIRTVTGRRHLLVSSRYFELERIALPAGGQLDLGRDDGPAVLTVLHGEASAAGLGIATGGTLIAWPDEEDSTPAVLEAGSPVVMLMASLPVRSGEAV